MYPRATLRALPLLWLGSGLGAWLLGDAGSYHLGASGVTRELMFLVFTLGLLRRDRPSIAAGMIAFLFYGGMLLTVLPQEAGVSWQSHLGGAVGGILATCLFRHADPVPPRRRYSWELEEEEAERAAQAERDTYEPGSPRDMPVLWHRDAATDERGTLLPFRRGRGDERPRHGAGDAASFRARRDSTIHGRSKVLAAPGMTFPRRRLQSADAPGRRTADLPARRLRQREAMRCGPRPNGSIR